MHPHWLCSSSSNGAAGVHQVVSKKSSRSFDGKRMQSCYRCGKTGHHAGVCRHKDDICSFCGKKEHLQIVCLSKKKEEKTQKCFSRHYSVSFQEKVHQAREEQPLDKGESDSTDSSLYGLIGSTNVKPFEVTVIVDSIYKEIDTGATSSLVAESTFKELWPGRIV